MLLVAEDNLAPGIAVQFLDQCRITYRELELLEKTGVISDLHRQVRFVIGGIPKITYIADFTYVENGKLIAEDAKGVMTAVFKVKAALFREKYGEHWELRIT